jgi:hypothetical protein
MDEQGAAPKSGKRIYTSPEFKDYGSLAQITTTVGKNGNADGGTGSTKQTHS